MVSYLQEAQLINAFILLEVKMAQFLKIAELDTDDVAVVRDLEVLLGVHIMAYQTGLQMADLTDEQIKAVKGVEDQLGVILLAYDD
jgi:hypothetical protein